MITDPSLAINKQLRAITLNSGLRIQLINAFYLVGYGELIYQTAVYGT